MKQSKSSSRAVSERRVIDMTIYEIAEKIIESKNNDIAKAFTMHIGSLLINNGIVPIMTEYTGNDVKNITDANEYKLVMKYGVAFKKLDCSKHDKEIYNKAIDDFVEACDNQFVAMYGQRYVDMRDIVNIAEQLKAGGENEKEIVQEVAEEYNGGWISVKDRLPDKAGSYLVIGKSGGATVTRWYMPSEFYPEGHFGGNSADYIRYWMPRPEPPKERD